MGKHKKPDIHELDDSYDPWERQPTEDIASYQAFQIYRDMPYDTTLPQASRRQGGRSIRMVAEFVDAPRSTVGQWSVLWQWQSRVADYDRHLDETKRQAALEEIVSMAKRHATTAQLGLQALTVPVRALLQRLQTDENALDELQAINLSGKEGLIELVATVTRTMQALMAAERTARGLPAETTAVTATVATATLLDPDELREVGRILVDSGVITGATPAPDDEVHPT